MAEMNQSGGLRLWLQLARTALPLSRDMDSRFRAQFDQSLVRFDVMSQLERSPDGLPVGRLAELMVAATSGNITMLLQRMKSEGLIARRASPHDGRATIIELTELGAELFARMAAAQRLWIDDIMKDIPPRLIDELAVELSRLRAALPANGGK
jgi:DNA-binding MarR family transcriptional regulator